MVKNDNLTQSGLTVDTVRAVTIARKFLEQYHSPVIFRSSYLSDGMWVISMEVGLLKEDIIIVRVDSGTGKILGYDHVAPSA